jgi:hypothetical protein
MCRLARRTVAPHHRPRRGVEVFVAARPFQAFGGPLIQRMSDEMKAMLVDAGICHYMAIFREPTGRMIMFDFGPVGGDVHVDLHPCLRPTQTSTASIQDGKRKQKHRKKAVQGEVRITQVCYSLSMNIMLRNVNAMVARLMTSCDRFVDVVFQDHTMMMPLLSFTAISLPGNCLCGGCERPQFEIARV